MHCLGWYLLMTPGIAFQKSHQKGKRPQELGHQRPQRTLRHLPPYSQKIRNGSVSKPGTPQKSHQKDWIWAHWAEFLRRCILYREKKAIHLDISAPQPKKSVFVGLYKPFLFFFSKFGVGIIKSTNLLHSSTTRLSTKSPKNAGNEEVTDLQNLDENFEVGDLCGAAAETRGGRVTFGGLVV